MAQSDDYLDYLDLVLSESDDSDSDSDDSAPPSTLYPLFRQDHFLQLDDPYNTCLTMTITIRLDHQLPLISRADRVAVPIRTRRRPEPPQHYARPTRPGWRAPRTSAPVSTDSAPATAAAVSAVLSALVQLADPT